MYKKYLNKLNYTSLLKHSKDITNMRNWKEDFDSFVQNYLTIDNSLTGQNAYLQGANYWYAVSLIAGKLGWDY